jgi:hypothetical protein
MLSYSCETPAMQAAARLSGPRPSFLLVLAGSLGIVVPRLLGEPLIPYGGGAQYLEPIARLERAAVLRADGLPGPLEIDGDFPPLLPV